MRRERRRTDTADELIYGRIHCPGDTFLARPQFWPPFRSANSCLSWQVLIQLLLIGLCTGLLQADADLPASCVDCQGFNAGAVGESAK